ncbi:MAG: ShlB/FhaC/HecB family hemolysin secretion/activation protein [Verrucomicrobiota bacterium]
MQNRFRVFILLLAAATPVWAADTNAPVETTFDVRRYQVEGNTILPPRDFATRGDLDLPPREFDVLTNYTGRIAFSRLREAVGALQLVYRDLGFATVSVTLPQQKITNGIVTLKVIEGTLADIQVQGNRHYSARNVRRALPSLETNVLINTHKWFQPELDRANANPDRQIYPVVGPGPDPGTTAITLKVKDRLPLHGHLEINNKSTPGTPILRVDSAVQYNNLWQLNHQLGLQYNFSPQDMKEDRYGNFFDQPLVASYSGFYRLPLGVGTGLRETYDRLPVDFGYDQVTRKFNLPPATGNPELTVYASRSASDTPVRMGAVNLITNTALADISSQFAQRNLTFTENFGLKLSIPLREFYDVRSTLLVGADFKTFNATTFNTNLTYFDLYSLDQFGNRVLVTNQTIALGANSRAELEYLPLSVGWVASHPDKWGATTFTWNQSIYLERLASARTNFQNVAGSRLAGGTFTVINAGLIRDVKLPHDWSAQFRANGQWASAPLISNEQFALGGTAGVRGFREGETYGDSGWRALFDLRAPPVGIGSFPTLTGDIPAQLRCSWFMDCGQVFHADPAFTGAPRLTEWGTGLGFFVTAGEHFDARLTLAWALSRNGVTSGPGVTEIKPGNLQAYFTVGFQF